MVRQLKTETSKTRKGRVRRVTKGSYSPAVRGELPEHNVLIEDMCNPAVVGVP